MLVLIHNECVGLSIVAFRTSVTDSILCYARELLQNLLGEKDLLNYDIKRKNTPSNYIGYNNFLNNKISFTTTTIKKPSNIHTKHIFPTE